MNKEEIEQMTEEERLYQLEWSDNHEFGTSYAYYLLEENKQIKHDLEIQNGTNELLDKEIQELYDNINEIKESLCVIEHNIEKYEEVGLNHLDFAYEKLEDTLSYVREILGDSNE